ncbi:hypothetical protein WA158_005626 [Blastocystis sp. Blastoise]
MDGICRDFMNGKCFRGDACPLAHPNLEKAFEGDAPVRFIATSVQLIDETTNKEKIEKIENEKVGIDPDLVKLEKKPLYDQLKANYDKDQIELAEKARNKLSIQPISDEEFKDYEIQRQIKERKEKEIKEKNERELKMFEQAQKSKLQDRSGILASEIDFTSVSINKKPANVSNNKSNTIKIIKKPIIKKKSSISIEKKCIDNNKEITSKTKLASSNNSINTPQQVITSSLTGLIGYDSDDDDSNE